MSVDTGAAGARTSYGALLRRPGTAAFVVAGWFGRYPRASLSLGIVLLVSAASGSFAVSGIVAAVFVFGMAIGGPLWSAAMDRIGQSRAIGWSLVALVATTGTLVIVVRMDAPIGIWFGAAFTSGLSSADIGSAVRARWSGLVAGTDQQAAFALESVADESVFVVAPPLATVLAASVDSAAGVVLVLVSGVIGGLALVIQTRTQPGRHPRVRTNGLRARLPPVSVLPVTLGCVGIGAMFGAFDLTSVGWASERGQPGLAGVVIAAFGLSSAAGALLYGAIRWKSGLVRRYVISGCAMAIVIAVIPVTGGSLLLIPATLFVGIVLAPVLVGGFAIAESRAPAGRTTEILAYPAAGLSIGVTVGATWAGAVLDASGAQSAFVVAAGAGIAAVVAAAVAEALLRSTALRRQADAPPAPSPDR